MIEYIYPVPVYYGDDPEDVDTTYYEGTIYSAVSADGRHEIDMYTRRKCYHMVIGSYSKGTYLCIPERHFSCDIGHPDNINFNLEALLHNEENLSYEESCAIAYALKIIGKVFNVQ